MVTRPLVTSLARTDAFDITSISWDIDWRSQSTGDRVSGRRHVAIGQLPRWIGAPEYQVLAETLGAWRASRLSGMGLIGIWRVRMFDYATYASEVIGSAGFSGGVAFSGGAGVLVPPVVPVVGDVSPGATEIVVDETALPAPIVVGQILSFMDWPFAVSWRDGAGAAVTLGVEMPIRKAMSDGDLIDLSATGLFELIDARDGQLRYDFPIVERRQLRFQEWLR